MKTTMFTSISVTDLSSVVGGDGGVEFQPACAGDQRYAVTKVWNRLFGGFPAPACGRDAHPARLVITSPATMYSGEGPDGKGVQMTEKAAIQAGTLLQNLTPSSP